MVRRPVNLIADLAHLHPLQQPLAQHEHIEPPPEVLLPAAEAVGEVCVVLVGGVQVTPDVDEFGRILRCIGWGNEDVLESRRLGLGVAGRLVPVGLWVGEVWEEIFS